MSDIVNIEWKHLNSSNLEAYSYSESGDLYVKFKSGKIYCYHNVDEKLIKGLELASSKGSFFSARIKNNFPFTPL